MVPNCSRCKTAAFHVSWHNFGLEWMLSHGHKSWWWRDTVVNIIEIVMEDDHIIQKGKCSQTSNKVQWHSINWISTEIISCRTMLKSKCNWIMQQNYSNWWWKSTLRWFLHWNKCSYVTKFEDVCKYPTRMNWTKVRFHPSCSECISINASKLKAREWIAMNCWKPALNLS